MKIEIMRWRILVILLFAITFTLIGWLAPALYATYVPQEHIMEVHEFTAQNTTTEAEEHFVCFDRTVHRASSAEVFTELYILDEDNERIKVSFEKGNRYFQEGQSQAVTKYELPNNLTEGTYKYVLVTKFDMSDGRVTRTFAFESEPFKISDSIQPNEARSAAIERCNT